MTTLSERLKQVNEKYNASRRGKPIGERGRYEPLPEGTYKVEFCDVRLHQGTNKKGDDQYIVNLIFRVLEGEYTGRLPRTNDNLFMDWQLRRFVDSIKKLDIDLEEITQESLTDTLALAAQEGILCEVKMEHNQSGDRIFENLSVTRLLSERGESDDSWDESEEAEEPPVVDEEETPPLPFEEPEAPPPTDKQVDTQFEDGGDEEHQNGSWAEGDKAKWHDTSSGRNRNVTVVKVFDQGCEVSYAVGKNPDKRAKVRFANLQKVEEKPQPKLEVVTDEFEPGVQVIDDKDDLDWDDA